MITQPEVLNEDSVEFFQLKTACKILEDLTSEMTFNIKDIYFDAGQDWKWTTIVAYNLKDDNHWQCLSPKDWKEIIYSENSNQIKQICERMIQKYPRLYNKKSEK